MPTATGFRCQDPGARCSCGGACLPLVGRPRKPASTEGSYRRRTPKRVWRPSRVMGDWRRVSASHCRPTWVQPGERQGPKLRVCNGGKPSLSPLAQGPMPGLHKNKTDKQNNSKNLKTIVSVWKGSQMGKLGLLVLVVTTVFQAAVVPWRTLPSH